MTNTREQREVALILNCSNRVSQRASQHMWDFAGEEEGLACEEAKLEVC